MNIKHAIKKIVEIQNGSGLDKENYPEDWKGSLAKKLWYEAKFGFGAEYGYILALLEVFNLTEEDFK